MQKSDHYCYPGTSVLKNKLNIRDGDVLSQAEADVTAGALLYLQMHPIHGNFDFAHLRKIHRYIFRELYSWAGKIRDVDIGKGNLFCRAVFINEYAKEVFKDFRSDCHNANTKVDFVKSLAFHYGNLNALHPFREGNGRTQREFTRELCLECGYILDLTPTSHQEMLTASKVSFDHGDPSLFEHIFNKCLFLPEQYEEYEKKLSEDILILSKDDI